MASGDGDKDGAEDRERAGEAKDRGERAGDNLSDLRALLQQDAHRRLARAERDDNIVNLESEISASHSD
jgi:hypothetical protein